MTRGSRSRFPRIGGLDPGSGGRERRRESTLTVSGLPQLSSVPPRTAPCLPDRSRSPISPPSPPQESLGQSCLQRKPPPLPPPLPLFLDKFRWDNETERDRRSQRLTGSARPHPNPRRTTGEGDSRESVRRGSTRHPTHRDFSSPASDLPLPPTTPSYFTLTLHLPRPLSSTHPMNLEL